MKAWKAVLPRDVNIYAVGGVTPANMKEWADAGCAGFGIGSNIYKPGMSPMMWARPHATSLRPGRT